MTSDAPSPDVNIDSIRLGENKVMNHFFHDFKGELSTAIMCLQSIRDEIVCMPRGCACEPWLDRAVRTCSHMVRLMNDYRDLTLMEEGAYPRQTELVDLAARAIRLRHLAEKLAAGRAILHFDVGSALPTVRFSATLFDRILSAVLEVVFSTIRVGRAVDILITRLDERGEHGMVEFDIRFDGVEFSKEELNTVFDKLAQTERGLQLGRAYTMLFCRVAARYIGGDLSLEPLPGRGARITINLPLGDLAS